MINDFLNIRNSGMKQKYHESKKFIKWYEEELLKHRLITDKNQIVKNEINELRIEVVIRKNYLKKMNISDSFDHPYIHQIAWRLKRIKKLLKQLYKPE